MHSNKIIRLICKTILDNMLPCKIILGKIEFFPLSIKDFYPELDKCSKAFRIHILGHSFLSGESIKIHLKALKSSFFYFGYKLNNLSKDLLYYFLACFLASCFPG